MGVCIGLARVDDDGILEILTGAGDPTLHWSQDNFQPVLDRVPGWRNGTLHRELNEYEGTVIHNRDLETFVQALQRADLSDGDQRFDPGEVRQRIENLLSIAVEAIERGLGLGWT